jgi:hypothetical protein
VLREPRLQIGSGERAVVRLVERDVRCDAVAVERAPEAGFARERAFGLHVQDLHDRHTAARGGVGEPLHRGEKRRDIGLAPVRAMAERLLDVDDDEGGIGRGAHRA